MHQVDEIKGILNLGGTSFANSIVQVLHGINIFRQTVYQLPYNETTLVSDLQKLFSEIDEFSDPKSRSISSCLLTNRLNWSNYEEKDLLQAFLDLFKRIEDDVRDNNWNNLVIELFYGRKQLTNSAGEVSTEKFNYISLPIDQVLSIIDSINNQFHTENTSLLTLPSIFVFQLNKLEDTNDYSTALMNNSFFALDLNSYISANKNTSELNNNENKSESINNIDLNLNDSVDNIYLLHSVIVNSNKLNHNYVYIRPDIELYCNNPMESYLQWYLCDDLLTKPVSESEVIRTVQVDAKDTTKDLACMLVYIKKSRITPTTSRLDAIPAELLQKLKEVGKQACEFQEKEKKITDLTLKSTFSSFEFENDIILSQLDAKIIEKVRMKKKFIFTEFQLKEEIEIFCRSFDFSLQTSISTDNDKRNCILNAEAVFDSLFNDLQQKESQYATDVTTVDNQADSNNLTDISNIINDPKMVEKSKLVLAKKKDLEMKIEKINLEIATIKSWLNVSQDKQLVLNILNEKKNKLSLIKDKKSELNKLESESRILESRATNSSIAPNNLSDYVEDYSDQSRQRNEQLKEQKEQLKFEYSKKNSKMLEQLIQEKENEKKNKEAEINSILSKTVSNQNALIEKQNNLQATRQSISETQTSQVNAENELKSLEDRKRTLEASLNQLTTDTVNLTGQIQSLQQQIERTKLVIKARSCQLYDSNGATNAFIQVIRDGNVIDTIGPGRTGRGFNIAVINRNDGSTKAFRSFDTCGDGNAQDRAVEFIQNSFDRNNNILVAISVDEMSNCLNRARTTLRNNYGMDPPNQWRQAWFFIKDGNNVPNQAKGRDVNNSNRESRGYYIDSPDLEIPGYRAPIVDQCNAEIRELQNQINQKNEQIANGKTELSSLSPLFDANNVSRTNLRSQLEKLNISLNDINAAITKLETNIQQQNNEKDILMAQQQKIKETIEKYNKEKETVSTRTDSSIGNDAWKLNIVNLHTDITNKQASISTLINDNLPSLKAKIQETESSARKMTIDSNISTTSLLLQNNFWMKLISWLQRDIKMENEWLSYLNMSSPSEESNRNLPSSEDLSNQILQNNEIFIVQVTSRTDIIEKQYAMFQDQNNNKLTEDQMFQLNLNYVSQFKDLEDEFIFVKEFFDKENAIQDLQMKINDFREVIKNEESKLEIYEIDQSEFVSDLTAILEKQETINDVSSNSYTRVINQEIDRLFLLLNDTQKSFNSITNEENLPLEEELEKNLLILCGFDSLTNGKPLTSEESLICLLISNVFDYQNIYNQEKLNVMMNLEAESQLQKLLDKYQAYHYDTVNIQTIIDLVNEEYEDENTQFIIEINGNKYSSNSNSQDSMNKIHLYCYQNIHGLYFSVHHLLDYSFDKEDPLNDIVLKYEYLYSKVQHKVDYSYLNTLFQGKYQDILKNLSNNTMLNTFYQNQVMKIQKLSSLIEIRDDIFNDKEKGKEKENDKETLFIQLTELNTLQTFIYSHKNSFNVEDFYQIDLENKKKLNDLKQAYSDYFHRLTEEEIKNRNLQNKMNDLMNQLKQEELIYNSEQLKLKQQIAMKENLLHEKEIFLHQLQLVKDNNDEKYLANEKQLKEEIEQLKTDLSTLNNQITDSKSHQEELKATIANLSSTISEDKESIKLNEDKIKEIEADLEKKRSERRNIQYNIADLDGDITIANKRKDVALEELSNEIIKMKYSLIWMAFINILKDICTKDEIFMKRNEILSELNKPGYLLKGVIDLIGTSEGISSDVSKFIEKQTSSGDPTYDFIQDLPPLDIKDKFDFMINEIDHPKFDSFIMTIEPNGKEKVKTIMKPALGIMDLTYEKKQQRNGGNELIQKIVINGVNLSMEDIMLAIQNNLLEKMNSAGILKYTFQDGYLFVGSSFLKSLKETFDEIDNKCQSNLSTLIKSRVNIKYRESQRETIMNAVDKASDALQVLRITIMDVVRMFFIQEIEIVSTGKVFMDQSETNLYGTNLTIVANDLHFGSLDNNSLNGMVYLRVKGRNGEAFAEDQAENGVNAILPEKGGAGANGIAGDHGQHAGNINIKITNGITGLGNLDAIDVSGGNARAGQLGGNGGKGGDGKQGKGGEKRDIDSDYIQSIVTKAKPTIEPGLGGDAGRDAEDGKIGTFGFITIIANDFELSFGEKRAFKGNHSFILSDGTVWNAEQRIISNDGKVWHPVNDKEEPITKTKRGGDAGIAKSDALDKCCSREPANKISYWKHGRAKWTSGLIEHNGYFFDRIKSSYEKNNIQYLKQLTGWNYHIQDCGYYTPSTSDCKDKNKVHIDNDEEISTERTEGGLVQGPAGLVHHGWYFIPDHASQEDMNESQRRNQERINQRNTVTQQEYEKLNSSIKMTNQVQQQEQNQVSDISTSLSKLNTSTIVNENAIGNDSYKLVIDQMKVNQENLQSTITENDSKIKVAQEKKQNFENELQALNKEINDKENELQEYEKATETIKEKVYANEEERNQAQQALHDEMNRLNDLQYANAVKEAEKSLNDKDVTKGQQYHNDKSNEISKASEKTKNEIENDKKELNQLLDEINQLSDRNSKISSDINERNSNSSSLNENESVKRVNLEKTNARFQQEEEVRNEIRANMAGGQSNQAKTINNLLDINLFNGIEVNYRSQLIEFIDQLSARQFLRLEANLLLQLSTTQNLNYYENEQLISNFKNIFQLYFTPDHVNHMMLILCLMNKRENFMVSINQFLQIMKFKQLIQFQYEEKENDILFKCKFNAMYASINEFISSSSNKKQSYDAQDILDLFQSLFKSFVGLKDTIIVGQEAFKKRSQFQFLYSLLLEKYGLQLVCQAIKVKLFTFQDDLLINEESQKKLNSLQLIENSFPSISIHPKLVKSLFLLNDLHNEISLETIQPLLSLTSDKEFDDFNKSLAYSSSSAVESSSSATIIDVVTDKKVTFSYEVLLNKVLLTFPNISKELKTNLTYSVLQPIQNIYLKYSYEENREIQFSYLDNHIQYLKNSLLDQFYSEELSKEVEENTKALSNSSGNNDNGKAKEMKDNYDRLTNAMKDYGCGFSLLRGHYDAVNERFQEQLKAKTPFKVTNDDVRMILTSQQREIIWTDDRIQSFITLLQTIDIEVYDQPITNTDSFDRIYQTLLSINYINVFQDFLIIKGSISLTLKRIKEIAIQDIKYGLDAQIVKDQIIALKTAFQGLLTEEDESNDEVITPIITSIDCILQEIHLEEETAKFFKMIKETNSKLLDIIPLVNDFDGFSSLNDTNLLIEIINVLHSATKNELASITVEDLSQFLKFLDYSEVNYLSLDWNAIDKEIKNTESFKERLSTPIQSNSFITNLIQQRINNLQNLTLIKLFDEISYKSKFFPDEMRNVIQSCEEIILQRRFLEFNFEKREELVVSIYEDVVLPYSKLTSDEDRRNKAKMLKEIQQTIETSQLTYFYEKNSLGAASIVDLVNNYLNYCLRNLLNETDSSIYYKQLEYFLLSSDQRITTTIPLNELLSTKVVGNDPATSESVPNPMADDDNYQSLVKNANSLSQLLATYLDNVFNKEISSIFHDFRESRFHYQHILNQIKDSIMVKYKKLINYVNDQESNSKILYLSILFERLFTLQALKQTNNNNKKNEIISYFKDLSLAINEMDYYKNVLDKFIDEINQNSLSNVNREKIKQFILILQPIFHDDQVKNNYQGKSFPCETVNQCLEIFIIIKNILLTNIDEGTPIIVTKESNLSIDLFTNFISVIQYTIFSKEKENNEDIIDLLYDLRIGFDLFQGLQGINKELKRKIMEVKDLLTEQMILLDYSNSSNVNSLGNMNDYYEYTRQEQEMKMKESHKLLITNQLLNPFLISNTPEKKSDPIDQPESTDADDEERENGDESDEVVDDNTVDNLTKEVLTASKNFITFVTETQLYDDNQIQLLSSNLEITSYISLENDSITEYYELLLILEDEYFTQQYYNGGTNAFNTILKIIEHFKEFYNLQTVSKVISRYSGELHLISYLLLAKLNDILQTIINDSSSSSSSSSSSELLASSKRVIIKLNEKYLKLSLKIQEDIDANLLTLEEIQSMNKLFEFFTHQLQIRLENDNQMELNLITQILSLLIKTFSYKKKSIIENQLLSNTNLYDWPIILTKEHYRMQLMSLQCTNKLKEKIVDELIILTEKDKELTRNIIELITNSLTKPNKPTAEEESTTFTVEDETIQKDLHQKIGFSLLQIIDNFISGLFIFDKITFNLLKDNNNDPTTTESSNGSDYLLKWYEIIEKDSNERRKSKDRSLEELVLLMAEPNKIQESYAINNSIQGIILENKQGVRPILELFKQVKVSYQDKIKEEWTKDDIKEYAKTLLGKQREEAFDWNGSILPKLIATIKKAAKLCFGDPPLDTQLIALVVYLDGASRGKQGRLGNIGTGEGKTHIAAFLAVCLCLLGEKVDIVTSSKVLAYRETQNKELMEFYQCFGLIADNNCDEDAELFGEVGKEICRKRYQKANIMYGDTGSFQRDILLTRFFGDKIRLDAGTDQGIAGITNNVANNLILDEVDSMLLDNSSKTLYISHNIIDLRWLRDVFVHIWNMIHAPDAQDGSYQAMELVEKAILQLINDKTIILPEESTQSTIIKYVHQNLKTWIKNAYYANRLEEDNHYIIGDKESSKYGHVIPIAKDTGIEQLNTNWNNGLTQFIQLKHSLELTDETLKAVFISSIKYFQMYPFINGMTGTIGGEKERNLLKRVYNLEFFEVPRLTSFSFIQEKGIVCGTKGEFLNTISYEINKKCCLFDDTNNLDVNRKEIIEKETKKITKKIKEFDEITKKKQEFSDNVTNLKQKTNRTTEEDSEIKKLETELKNITEEFNRQNEDKGKNEHNYDQLTKEGVIKDIRRSVLVICDSINDVDDIKATLQSTLSNYNKLIIYDRAYNGLKNEDKLLNPGDIVIATNIAGRGTSFKTSSLLEINGGLHVIVAYVPANLRIEDQAFGRTCRKGKKGSGQFIVYDYRKENDTNLSINYLKNERDRKEIENLEEMEYRELKSIQLEGDLFDKFNLFNQKMDIQLKNQYHSISKEIYQLQLANLRNHWAFWLCYHEEDMKQSFNNEKKQFMYQKYQEFEDSIRQKVMNTQQYPFSLIEEPVELTKLGYLYYKKGRHDKAQEVFSYIIQKYPSLSAQAHYYQAMSIIDGGDGGKDNRISCKNELKQSCKLLNEERSRISNRQQIIQNLYKMYQKTSRKGGTPDLFSLSLEEESNILLQHISAIQNQMGSIFTEDGLKSGLIYGDKLYFLFNSLVKKNEMIKDYRLSKKCIINKDKKTISYPNNSMKIDIPEDYHYCQDQILSKLLDLSGATKTYQQRKIPKDSFKEIVFSLDILNDIILTSKKIQKIKILKLINNSSFLEKKLDDPFFQGKGKFIKELLKGKSTILTTSGAADAAAAGKECYFVTDDNFIDSNKQIARLKQSDFESYLKTILSITKENDIQEIIKALGPQDMIKCPSSIQNPSTQILDDEQKMIDVKHIFEKYVNKEVAKQILFNELQDLVPKDSDKLRFINEFQCEIIQKNGILEIEEEFCWMESEKEIENFYQTIKLSTNQMTIEGIDGKIDQLHLDEITKDTQIQVHLKELIRNRYHNHQNLIEQRDFIQLFSSSPTTSAISEDELEYKYDLFRELLKDNQFIEKSFFEELELTSLTNEEIHFQQLIEDYLTLFIKCKGHLPLNKNLNLGNKQEESEKLWNYFFDSQIIKDRVIHLKIVSNPPMDEIEKKIKKEVKDIFREEVNQEEWHDWINPFEDLTKKDDSKAKSYVDDIVEHIKNLAGTLKIYKKVKVEYKSIEEFFQEDNIPPAIIDYAAMLFVQAIYLVEKKDGWTWSWDAFWCTMIGLGQICLGVALAVATFGGSAQLSEMLISEGIGDMVFAIQAQINGDFTWKAYVQHKILSLAITVLTMGVGTLLSKAGTTAGKTAAEVATEVAAKRASKLALTATLLGKIGLNVVKVGIEIGINQAADAASDAIMDELISDKLDSELKKIGQSDEANQKRKEIIRLLKLLYQQYPNGQAMAIFNQCVDDCFMQVQQGDLSNKIMNHIETISSIFDDAKRYKGKAALVMRFMQAAIQSAIVIKAIVDISQLYIEIFNRLIEQLKEKTSSSSSQSSTSNVVDNDTSHDEEINKAIKDLDEKIVKEIKSETKSKLLNRTIRLGLNKLNQKTTGKIIDKGMKSLDGVIESHQKYRGEELIANIDQQNKQLTHSNYRLLIKTGLLNEEDSSSIKKNIGKIDANGQEAVSFKNYNKDQVKKITESELHSAKVFAMKGNYYLLPESGLRLSINKYLNLAYKTHVKEVTEGKKGASDLELNVMHQTTAIPKPLQVIKDDEIPQGEGIIVKIRSNKEENRNHFIPILGHEEVDINLLSNDINASDKKCGARAVLLAGKYDEFKNKGQSHEMAKENAMKYVLKEENMKKFMLNYKKTALKTKVTRDLFEQGEYRNRQDWIGEGRSLATKAMRDVPLRATQCHKLAQKDTKESLLENGKDRNITSAIDRHEKLRAPAYDEMEKMVTKLFNAKTFPLIPDDVLKQVTVRKAASYQNERGWKDATRKAQSLREAEVDLLLKKKPKTLLKDCTNVHAAHRFAPTVNVSRVVTWVRKELNNTPPANSTKITQLEQIREHCFKIIEHQSRTDLVPSGYNLSTFERQTDNDQFNDIYTHLKGIKKGRGI